MYEENNDDCRLGYSCRDVVGCMMFDRSTDRSDRYDRDDSGYSCFGGHSHH